MYKGYISWIDLLLVPLFFVVLYMVMLVIRHRHRDNPLYRKYLVKGFVVKMVCTVFYCCIIYFYYEFGDSINYFKNVLFSVTGSRRGVNRWPYCSAKRVT